MSKKEFGDCPKCNETARLRQRNFSDKATAALIVWGELDKELVDKPICDECYNDLRETLIDRSGELADSDSIKSAS